MKKLFVILGILLLIPAALYSIFLAAGIYRSIFSPYLDEEISGPIIVSPEWLAISPKRPLRADRQVQYVMVNFSQSGQPEVNSLGLRLPDGTLIIPEVELVDDSG